MWIWEKHRIGIFFFWRFIYLHTVLSTHITKQNLVYANYKLYFSHLQQPMYITNHLPWTRKVHLALSQSFWRLIILMDFQGLCRNTKKLIYSHACLYIYIVLYIYTYINTYTYIHTIIVFKIESYSNFTLLFFSKYVTYMDTYIHDMDHPYEFTVFSIAVYHSIVSMWHEYCIRYLLLDHPDPLSTHL